MANGIKWSGGGPKAMSSALDGVVPDLQEAIASALQEVAIDGEGGMRKIVELSVTPTGAARARNGGGLPGRIESSDMIDDISSEVEVSGDVVTASWGWLDEFKKYYWVQEHGYGPITAMNAILTTYTAAVQKLAPTLSRIVRGK